jgi:Flp pilus assembly protein CpaB
VLFRRKLPRSSFVLLSISLVCALASAIVMRAYALRLDATRPDGGPPVEVVIAARDVARGSMLPEEALEVLTMPSGFTPPGALHDLAHATGRIAITDLAAGEIVTELRLAHGGSGPTASLVPAGMRAVQIPVAATAGVAPGDLVDVIGTFGGGGAHTEVTGEALEVLAVRRGGAGGSFGAAGTTTSGSVGLIVLATPDDAERLVFASVFASLSIAVHGPDDALPEDTFGVPVTDGG